MSNKFAQTAVQVQTQQQTLTPQQVLSIKLTELPLESLRERINAELEDNQWLEAKEGSQTAKETVKEKATQDNYTSEEDSFDDNDFTVPRTFSRNTGDTQREIGDYAETFYDHLVNQIGEFDLTPHEREIVCYLIGSLEDDGMMRASMQQIADELDIYHAIPTDEKELEHLLTTVVQQMEPAGIGARDLQECLVLQTKRNYDGATRKQLLRLFTQNWEDFRLMHWDKIKASMKLDDNELEQMKKRVRHLTPRPGGSLGNKNDAKNATVTPDFIVTLDDEGKLHLRLNEAGLPDLVVSPDAEEALDIPLVTTEDYEAVRYMRQQVLSAKVFIGALQARRETMILTMSEILKLQRSFFLTGDVKKLKPMNLEDVSKRTGRDISTTSRVVNSKYVKTPYGTYPLSWFFSRASMKDGDKVSLRSVLSTLRELVDGEDKEHPLTDEKLTELLREQGYDIARRTVAKHRIKLGIPESRLR